ncbi:MAG TPA: hypothetical protein VMA09_08700 [Candidatus Binataceae bacterium]|nr:hypothetical protein [Candidatus Binataceae bacterium]
MEGQRPSLLFLCIAAILGGTFAVSPGRAASTSANPAAAISATRAQAASSAPEHSGLAEVNEYLCGGDAPGCAAYQDARAGNYSINTLVAIVPDPVESGLRSDFDNSIDSIQRAAGMAGFLPDRFDLPWVPSATSDSSESRVKTGLGDDDSNSGGGIKRNPEREPGLMLFRDKSGRSLLLLFLIGETPTAGIHKTAMSLTAAQMCALREEFPPRPDGGGFNSGSVKIMGPTYSGSAESLQLAITDASAVLKACGLDRIDIVSGSASAVKAQDFTSIPGVSFHATTLPSESEINTLMNAFEARPGEFALLSEEGTSFGEGLRQRKEASSKPHHGMTYLGFPIHVAELENAAAQEQQAEAASASIPGIGHQDLLLVSPAESRRDVVPLYSSSTPAVIDLILQELLIALKEPQVHYVVIAATDVQDSIYLAQQVRAANPNAKIIALNSHLLYLHSEFNPTLRGMLVASPYPLFIEDQFWHPAAGTTRRPIQFPSDEAEGIYNATLAQLGAAAAMVDYGLPGRSNKPPLWISVVGRNGMWPIAAVDVADTQGYTIEGPPAQDLGAQHAFITPWTILIFAVIVGGVGFAILMASLALIWPDRLPAGIVQYAGGAVLPEHRSDRRVYQLEAAGIALALLATFAIYLLLQGSWPGTYPATSVGNDAAIWQMRVFRATHLGNGVSPLMPVLLASIAALILLGAAIRRRVLMDTHQLLTPYLGFQTDSFEGVEALEQRVRIALERPLTRSLVWWIVAGATAAFYVLVLRSWQYEPLDGGFLEWMYLSLSLVAYLCIVRAIFRLVALWLATRRLLHRMYWHPSREGYARLYSDMPGEKASTIDLLSATATMVPLEAGLHYARAIEKYPCDEHAAGAVASRLRESRARLGDAISDTERGVRKTLEANAQGEWREEIRKRRDAEHEAGAMSRAVAYICEPGWREIDPGADAAWDKEQELVALGEAYVATRVVDLLRAVIPHLRTLAISSTLAVLLMLMAASSYPFPYGDDLLWFGWALVIAGAGSTTWMFLSMNRERVLSLISGTTPGALNWNSTLVLQIATHALIPIMVLLGAAFPERLSRIAGWLGGILGGGHG